MGQNFEDFTGSTPLSQSELNRRFYQLDRVLEEFKDGNIFGASSDLNITIPGAITVTGANHTVSANSGVTDNLDTINGTIEGQVITLAAASGDTITMRDGVGNIVSMTGADVVMSGNQQYELMNNGTNLVITNVIDSQFLREEAAHTILGGSVANIDIQNITAAGASLLLVIGLRSDRVADADGLLVRFNNDSGANYYSITHRQNDVTLASAESLAGTSLTFLDIMPGANAPANYTGMVIMHIHNYTSITKPRFVHWQGYMQDGNSSGDLFYTYGGGVWLNTAAAINRITLTPNTGPNWSEGHYALYRFGTAP